MIQFWLDNPSILFNKDQMSFWPIVGMTHYEKLNAITRLVIILTLFGFIITSSASFIGIGLFTLACIVAYAKYIVPEKKKEAFTQRVENHTVPTEKNPLMNVLLPELNGNPNRKSALLSYEPTTYDTINKQVKKRIPAEALKGTNEEMNLQYSMRQFYTTANTTVPNDQEGFSHFLYGDMPSGKDGNKEALYNNVGRLGAVYGNNTNSVEKSKINVNNLISL